MDGGFGGGFDFGGQGSMVFKGVGGLGVGFNIWEGYFFVLGENSGVFGIGFSKDGLFLYSFFLLFLGVVEWGFSFGDFIFGG